MNRAPEGQIAALAGRYAIGAPIGAGGMAPVYRARDEKHGREVALKVLRPEVAGLLGRERSLREIRLPARLTHPHILPLHDPGDAEGILQLTMPLMREDTLQDRMERESRPPVDEAVRLLGEVADALEEQDRGRQGP